MMNRLYMISLTLALSLAVTVAQAMVERNQTLGGLGDRVWYDADADGEQDAGEPGIPGAKVCLYIDGFPGYLYAWTVTNASGLYGFSYLPALTYQVQVALPTGLETYAPTFDFDGIASPNQAMVPLAAGEYNDRIDFGYTMEDDRPYQTQTQGGWGAEPSGANPGAMLHADFTGIYPNGLVVGSLNWLRFDDPQEITGFLPQGGKAGTLWYRSYDPPTGKTEAGVFAGQVLALRLNVDFSAAGVTRRGLGSLIITRGPFAGETVAWLLDLCEEVLGGNSSGLQYSLSQLNDAATAVNENYVDGLQDKGYLTESTLP